MTVSAKIFSHIFAVAFILFFSAMALAQNVPGQVPAKSPAPAQAGPASPARGGSDALTDPAANEVVLPELKAFIPGGYKPIIIEEPTQTLNDRLKIPITLDVREMNVIDVLKFLALKGDFNLVTSPTVTGRVTLFLKNVTIQDALDIVLIANNLAYNIEAEDIIHVMTQIEYEAMLGRKFRDKMKVEIVQLKYAKPSYILSALDSIKSNLGKIIIDEDTGSIVLIDTDESLTRRRPIIGVMETPLDAIVYAVQYAKADVLAEKLRTRIDANAVGSLTTDERSNQIIVRAFPGRRDEVMKLMKSLDKQTKEVLVEARVLQVVFKPQFDFGIDWNFDFKNTQFGDLSFKSFLMDDENPTANLASKFFRFSTGAVNIHDFQTQIRTLKQVSDTKIISNPKILVTNNEEAKIHIGDTVPYIISTTSGTGDNAITSEDVRFVDVGLKLNVTPTINDDGYVTMRLAPEISTVTTSIQSKGGGIPQVNKTLVETTVMIKDGETIIMGGLKKDNKSKFRRGLPILMDLPLIGKIFGVDSDSIERTEIVIFITPHIIKEEDFKDYGKFRGQMKPSQDMSTKDEPPAAVKPKATVKTTTEILAPNDKLGTGELEQPGNEELKLKE